MRTANNLVCCEIFPFTGIKTEKRESGLLQMANHSELVALRVLADGPDGIMSGDTVYVSGKDVKAPWAQVHYKIGDKQGMFAPLSSIFMVQSLEE